MAEAYQLHGVDTTSSRHTASDELLHTQSQTRSFLSVCISKLQARPQLPKKNVQVQSSLTCL